MVEKTYTEEEISRQHYAEPGGIDLKSTATIAQMMIGFLDSEPLKLGGGVIRDEFRGLMYKLYETLDGLLEDCVQAAGSVETEPAPF